MTRHGLGMVTKSKIRKMIAKEEFSNYKYAESMVNTPTQESLDSEKKSKMPEKQIAKRRI